MFKGKVKQYTKGLKESAIRLAIESKQSIAQTARELRAVLQTEDRGKKRQGFLLLFSRQEDCE